MSMASDPSMPSEKQMKTSRPPAAEVAAQLENDLNGLTIEFADPLPMRVPEGIHDAIITSIRLLELNRWKRSCLVFKFKIQELGPANGVILPGYVNLGTKDRHQAAKPSTASKLARWWRVVADHTGGQRKRVSLREFRHFLFQVRVANVKTDNREQDIPDAAQEQIVAEIAAIVQRLGTGQPATQPPDLVHNERPVTTQTSGYPPFIPGLGPLMKHAIHRCEECDELTAFSYGCRPFCCTHARQHAEGAR